MLSNVDFSQAFPQIGQSLGGFGRGLLQAFANAFGHSEKFFIHNLENRHFLLADGLGNLVLLLGAMFAQLGQPAGKFSLAAQQNVAEGAQLPAVPAKEQNSNVGEEENPHQHYQNRFKIRGYKIT